MGGVKLNPVFGIPIVIYFLPLEEIPTRKPEIPQLIPTPPFENVVFIGPKENIFLNIQLII